MTGSRTAFAAPLTVIPVLLLLACSTHHTATTSAVSSRAAGQDNTQADGGISGQSVTKEVPFSKESVPDIKAREAKEPLPPRGDVAIPLQPKPRGDNAALPSPTAPGPEGKIDPSGGKPGESGGSR